MANATQFYQSPLLSNLAQRWRNTKMIAGDLFPTVPVPKDTFQYLKFDQDIAFRIQDDRMAPYASANQIDLKATKVTATVTDKALKAYIDQKEKSQVPELQLQQLKTSMVMESLLLAKESRAATTLRATATYASSSYYTTLSGTGQWSNASSDPKNAVLTVRDSLLIPSDAELVMWMGRDVYTGLQQNPKVLAAVQYTNAGAVDTRSILAQYLQVDRIVVGEAFQATNNMGQTLATSRVWGKDAGLLVVNKNAPSGIGQLPTFGITATSTQNGGLWRTYLARDPERGTAEGVDIVKVEGTYDLIVQANTLGYLWKNAVA